MRASAVRSLLALRPGPVRWSLRSPSVRSEPLGALPGAPPFIVRSPASSPTNRSSPAAERQPLASNGGKLGEPQHFQLG